MLSYTLHTCTPHTSHTHIHTSHTTHTHITTITHHTHITTVTHHRGERLVGRHTPAVYVFDIDTLQVSRVEGGPDDASCGQPAWTPDGVCVWCVCGGGGL